MNKKKNMAFTFLFAFLVIFSLCSCEKEKEVIPLKSINEEGSVGSEEKKEEDEVIPEVPSRGKEEENFPSEEATVTVYVCGAVIKTGVYELKDGARIVDALIAAGGLREEASRSYLNQAELLKDGSMIYVPTESEVVAGEEGAAGFGVMTGGGSLMTEASGGLVNINTADRSELMTLNGVGESKADKIIAYREENGGFKAIEDIMNIPGIKEGMFNKIRDQICVK